MTYFSCSFSIHWLKFLYQSSNILRVAVQLVCERAHSTFKCLDILWKTVLDKHTSDISHAYFGPFEWVNGCEVVLDKPHTTIGSKQDGFLDDSSLLLSKKSRILGQGEEEEDEDED